MEEYYFAVHILHDDPEHLGAAVNFLVPSEIGCNNKINAKQRSGNRLHVSLQATKIIE